MDYTPLFYFFLHRNISSADQYYLYIPLVVMSAQCRAMLLQCYAMSNKQKNAPWGRGRGVCVF